MQTEPEQWAVELWHAAYDSFENCATQSFGDDDKAAALTIQRAFEERERKLREALKEIRDNRTELNDRSDYARGWNDARFCLKNIAHQALKETPDAG